MASGMDWAMNALLSYLQIEPEQFKGQLANTTQIIVEAKQRLERIEANQLLILQLLQKGNEDVIAGPRSIAGSVESESAANTDRRIA